MERLRGGRGKDIIFIYLDFGELFDNIIKINLIRKVRPYEVDL